MKKFVVSCLVFIMTLATTFSSPALTAATADSNSSVQTHSEGCNCGLSEKKVGKGEAWQHLKKAGVTVNESLSRHEIAEVEKAIKKNDGLNEVLKEVEKTGFKKLKGSENYLAMNNLPIGNKLFESVTFVAGVLQSKDGKAAIVYEAVVDNTLQEVVKYQLLEVKDGKSKVLQEFQQETSPSPSIDWGGVQCDWIAVMVCAHHCYLWSAAGFFGVGICEVVCLATTIFVCNW